MGSWLLPPPQMCYHITSSHFLLFHGPDSLLKWDRELSVHLQPTNSCWILQSEMKPVDVTCKGKESC